MRDPETMLESIREFIEREQLFPAGQRPLVAASGGLDSTVLAYVLRDLGYSIDLAHVNYHLRGSDSDAEADAVTALADLFGCQCYVLNAPPPFPPPPGFNLQVWARQTRYSHFEKILDEYSNDVLVTGHHLDDNVETLLLNLLHGMGPAGARGIPARTQRPLPVARPLLETSRSEILAFARRRGITWREDRSNATYAYRRNRLRHQVVPALREEGLSEEGLRQTFRNLRSAERLYEGSLSSHPAVAIAAEGIVVTKRLLPPHPDDRLSLVWYFAAPRGFNRDQCRQLLYSERNLLLRSADYEVRSDPAIIVFRKFVLEDSGSVAVQELPVAIVWQNARYHFARAPATAARAADEVLRCRLPAMPLHLRPRQPYDAIRLPGMGGHRKKIKDLLIDAKVPAWDRARVPILTDANEEVIAVLGLRTAASVTLDGKETDVLIVRRENESPGKDVLSGA